MAAFLTIVGSPAGKLLAFLTPLDMHTCLHTQTCVCCGQQVGMRGMRAGTRLEAVTAGESLVCVTADGFISVFIGFVCQLPSRGKSCDGTQDITLSGA